MWRLVSILLFAGTHCAVQACTVDAELRSFVEQTYKTPIRFEVLRNGKPVGEHVTRFRNTSDGLVVESRMNLEIRFLFLTAYRFEYQSVARWCDKALVEMDARVDDNGEVRRTVARIENGEFVVRHGDRQLSTRPGVLPTNHWNPTVLTQTRGLNTLTGRINQVSLETCNSPLLKVDGASCHAYGGDLQARVWYDTQGAWVGLEFSGRDGSDIVYRCRDCRADIGT